MKSSSQLKKNCKNKNETSALSEISFALTHMLNCRTLTFNARGHPFKLGRPQSQSSTRYPTRSNTGSSSSATGWSVSHTGPTRVRPSPPLSTHWPRGR